jgi:hypothetical protein
MSDPALTGDQKVGHWIEMWKQTVQVQQHFNDIEWRIRGLALTAATFAIGAAAVAAKDGSSWAAPIVLVIGLLLWYAFYFVDRFWYHPLLKAAVAQGHKIEDHIAEYMPGADLARTISAGSPVPKPGVIKVLSLGRARDASMHSDHKLVWFYRLGGLALLAAALGLTIQAVASDEPKNETKPVVVNIDNGPATGPSPSRPRSPTTPSASPTASSPAPGGAE